VRLDVDLGADVSLPLSAAQGTVRPIGLGLDEKAMEALNRWRFEPGMRNGAPVTVAATVEVNFQLLW
jgi:hypothetical protein